MTTTDGLWLLEFDLAGATLRYATSPQQVTDLAGRTHAYRSGLRPLSVQLDGLESSQGVAVVDRNVSWGALAARGQLVERQPARLRYWAPGTTLEAATVIIEGRATASQFGDPNAPGQLVFTIRIDSGGTLYPPLSALVDDTTWLFDENVEQYDPAIEGAVYPTVLGYPGYLLKANGRAYAFMATPALLVQTTGPENETSELLVSLGNVDAAALLIYDYTASDESGAVPTSKVAQLDVVVKSDLIGETVATATNWPDPPTANDLIPVIGQRYYASWSPLSGRGAGIVHGGTAVRDLHVVLDWALRRSGRADIDLLAQASEATNLAQFKVDGFINQRLDTVAWAESELVRLFPIVRSRTARGIYWRFLNWEANVTDAVDSIDADLDATRASAVNVAQNQIANRFVIEYGHILPTGAYAGRRVLGADYQATTLSGGASATDERVIGSALCARSVADFGEIEASPIRSSFVWDTATAGLILQYRALRDALPRLFVSYYRANLAHLRRGDIVTVTDSEIGYDDAVAIVDSVQVSEGRLHRVNLEVLSLRLRSG